ncbi:hypothetical protein ABZY81_41125 [Streptomyces sp. NPDC006514]|uniref:hypothetical protein n=1 Tax=Streptomyces sp. NPDC006514 TaxID=3154308 RepID=UPI0033ABDED8
MVIRFDDVKAEDLGPVAHGGEGFEAEGKVSGQAGVIALGAVLGLVHVVVGPPLALWCAPLPVLRGQQQDQGHFGDAHAGAAASAVVLVP